MALPPFSLPMGAPQARAGPSFQGFAGPAAAAGAADDEATTSRGTGASRRRLRGGIGGRSRASRTTLALALAAACACWLLPEAAPARGLVFAAAPLRSSLSALRRPPSPRGGRVARAGTGETSADMKVMITQDEREALHALGYSEEEAMTMRVELATVVLERGTRRPWGDQPMPDSWRNMAAVAALSEGGDPVQRKADGPDAMGVLVGTLGGVVLAAAVAAVASAVLPIFKNGGPVGVNEDVLPEYTLRSAAIPSAPTSSQPPLALAPAPAAAPAPAPAPALAPAVTSVASA